MKKYCYLEPPYPPEAYFFAYFLNRNKEVLIIHPTEYLYTSIEEMSIRMKNSAAEYKKEGINCEDIGMLIPLTFDSLVPLKAEYWSTEGENLGILERWKSFMPVYRKPELYKILVTPSNFRKKSGSWDFTLPLSFPISATEALVENFMYFTKWPVDERAKYAAFYIPGKPLLFNWNSGSFLKEDPGENKKLPN